jgi:DNA primase
MPKIPQDFITEIISKISIVDFIAKYIQLKQFGPSFKANCPFHNEKTPSFSVSNTKQIYHCFGCGASGNVVTFAMEYNNIDFVNAIELLAREAGVEMPELSPGDDRLAGKYQAAKDLYNKITINYIDKFNNNDLAKEYVIKRGITKSNIDKFKIGYSEDVWDFVTKKYAKHTDLLLETGMLIKNNNKVYDRFRGRLMFPILNEKGIYIGFGARTLTDQTPKYLNSSDSFLFKKGLELYGLYQIISSRKKISSIIVVEGYMDVISLANHNINNAVASLGTAITKQQIQKILKYTNKITFCFDGDKAGKNAAWKALLNTIPLMHKGIYVKFVFLPEGEDPDSYVAKNGRNGIAEYFKSAQELTDYMFEHIKALHPGVDITSKTNYINACNDVIKTVPESVFKSLLEDRLNKMTGIPSPTQNSTISNKSKRFKKVSIDSKSRLLAILIQYPSSFKNNPEELEDIKNIFTGNETISSVINYIANNIENVSSALVLEKFKDEEELSSISHLFHIDLVIPEDGYLKEALEIISAIKKESIQENIDILLQKSKLGKLDSEERRLLQQLLQKQKM